MERLKNRPRRLFSRNSGSPALSKPDLLAQSAGGAGPDDLRAQAARIRTWREDSALLEEKRGKPQGKDDLGLPKRYSNKIPLGTVFTFSNLNILKYDKTMQY